MPADTWSSLLSCALLGTGRKPPALALAGEAVESLLARMQGTGPEELVLNAAAVLTPYRLAGALPPADSTPALIPAPPDARPYCSPASARHLEAVLGGQCVELIPEWLRLAAGAGVRAPESLQPALLDKLAAPQHRGVRPELRTVLGPSGQWLASQNSDWEYAAASAAGTPEAEPELWQTGDRAERLRLLECVRSRDPEAGRRLVESTWAEDPAGDRAQFIAALATGLGPGDEPLLEAALDDRLKDVRAAAALLLSRLPESRLVARMRDRLTPLLRYEPGSRSWMPGRSTPAGLVVELPGEIDRELQRDGLRNISGGAGPKAGLLRQMLACVPPARWCAAWNETPAGLIAAAKRTDWAETLLAGWTEAAERHRDAGWARALLEDTEACPVDQGGRLTGAALLGTLSQEERERLVLEILEAEKGLLVHHGELNRAFAVLRECRYPWSEALSHAVMAAVKRSLGKAAQTTAWTARQVLRELAMYVHPGIAVELPGGWPEAGSDAWGHWEKEVRAMLDIVGFRGEMHQEFNR